MTNMNNVYIYNNIYFAVSKNATPTFSKEIKNVAR